MKRAIILFLALLFPLAGCGKGLSPEQRQRGIEALNRLRPHLLSLQAECELAGALAGKDICALADRTVDLEAALLNVLAGGSVGDLLVAVAKGAELVQEILKLKEEKEGTHGQSGSDIDGGSGKEADGYRTFGGSESDAGHLPDVELEVQGSEGGFH